MSNLTVTINNSIVKNGEFIPLNKTQSEPKINYRSEPNEEYTIIMIDPDAPSSANPIYKYWLHLLIINNNQIIVPFEPPTPPKNSGKHRYIIYLLKQKQSIDKNKINLEKNGINIKRNNFNFAEFIHDNNLETLDSVYFRTENN
jgi:large subunit ribosomal protein L35